MYLERAVGWGRLSRGEAGERLK